MFFCETGCFFYLNTVCLGSEHPGTVSERELKPISKQIESLFYVRNS